MKSEFYKALSELAHALAEPERAELAEATLIYCLGELQALQEQARSRLQSLVFWRATSDIWMLLDGNGCLLDGNRGLEERAGHSLAEMQGVPVWSGATPDRQAFFQSLVTEAYSQDCPMSFELDCNWGNAEVLIQPIKSQFGGGMVLVLMRFWESQVLDPAQIEGRRQRNVIE